MQAMARVVSRTVSISWRSLAAMVRVFPLPGHAVSTKLPALATASFCCPVRLMASEATPPLVECRAAVRWRAQHGGLQSAQIEPCQTFSRFEVPCFLFRHRRPRSYSLTAEQEIVRLVLRPTSPSGQRVGLLLSRPNSVQDRPHRLRLALYSERALRQTALWLPYWLETQRTSFARSMLRACCVS